MSCVVAGAVVLVTSCWDPVHTDAVDALGPERKGVRPGPSHRPGQPCLTCHGGDGPGEPELSIAGTVYSAEGIAEPLSDVLVQITDATGVSHSVASNEVGNFYIAADQWRPVYPIRVELRDRRADENGRKPMLSTIGRAGDCATCHYGATNEPGHMPPVYLRAKAL